MGRRRANHRGWVLVTVLVGLFATAVGAHARTAPECEEARKLCDARIAPAVEKDDKLHAFLRRARADAGKASDGNGVHGYESASESSGTTTFAEKLALGCCLFSGECADEAASRARETDADGVRAAVRGVGARILYEAGKDVDGEKKFPGAALLGADARVCAGLGDGGATTCDEELVTMYTRAGNAGEDIGLVRAGDAVLKRYAAGLATRVRGESAEEECDVALGGDAKDALAARSLFTRLLASNRFDKLAADRLKELDRAEALWVDPTLGGNPDSAYELADALVRMLVRVSVAATVVVISFVFRRSFIVEKLWSLARSVLLINFVSSIYRRVTGFIAFLRGPPKARVDSRQARREEARKEAKKRH